MIDFPYAVAPIHSSLPICLEWESLINKMMMTWMTLTTLIDFNVEVQLHKDDDDINDYNVHNAEVLWGEDDDDFDNINDCVVHNVEVLLPSFCWKLDTVLQVRLPPVQPGAFDYLARCFCLVMFSTQFGFFTSLSKISWKFEFRSVQEGKTMPRNVQLLQVQESEWTLMVDHWINLWKNTRWPKRYWQPKLMIIVCIFSGTSQEWFSTTQFMFSVSCSSAFLWFPKRSWTESTFSPTMQKNWLRSGIASILSLSEICKASQFRMRRKFIVKEWLKWSSGCLVTIGQMNSW